MEIQNVVFGKWFIQYEVVWNKLFKSSVIVRIEALTFTCLHKTVVFVTRFKHMNIDNKRDTRWLIN